MPDKQVSGPFRLVGRLLPVGVPEDPEKAVFIDIPHANIVTHLPELHEFTDGILSTWHALEQPKTHIEIVQVDGTAYILHTGAPPEGYFPPMPEPPAFDF